MMRIRFLFFFLLSLNFGFAQNDSDAIYFPQEQLILPECANEADKNLCLKHFFGSRIENILEEDVNLSKAEKDTIKVSIYFDVLDNGEINDKSKSVFITDSVLRKTSGDNLETIFNSISNFEIINRKPDKYSSKHQLYFSFLRENGTGLNILESEPNLTYSGGIIEEPPIYPGCENIAIKNRIQCFNIGIQTHLKENFRYPRMAQKKKIQGRVFIMFKISPEGIVQDIRTRGPHIILEQEARRIIRLFPKCKPGLRNGKPVSTPFSIPITFKLGRK